MAPILQIRDDRNRTLVQQGVEQLAVGEGFDEHCDHAAANEAGAVRLLVADLEVKQFRAIVPQHAPCGRHDCGFRAARGNGSDQRPVVGDGKKAAKRSRR
jgi:hypothetical protein